MRRVGERCAAVNHDALQNPKLRLLFGDAREILLTIPARYDIVFSEPSNPYRAGVASLFTKEYYAAVRDRLAPGGLFLQWVQAYEVDAGTLRAIYATLGSVFPFVETWYLGWNDLALVASLSPPAHDARALRARLREEPYRRALALAWRTEGLEGLLAHYVAQPAFAESIAGAPAQELNTDDRNPVEFGFARQVGNFGSVADFFAPLRKEGLDRPELLNDDVDDERVEDERIFQVAGDGTEPTIPDGLPVDREVRAQAAVNYVSGNTDGAVAKWRFQEKTPAGVNELALLAEGTANAGDDEAPPLIAVLAREQPIEAKAHLARYRFRKGMRADAAALLAGALVALRDDPWPSSYVMGRAVELAKEIAVGGGDEARMLFDALERPFSVHILETTRKQARVHIAKELPDEDHCLRAWADLEPHVPWERDLLDARRTCYGRWNHPLARRAAQDLDAFDACQGFRGWLRCVQ
jgi:hypothetical protein